MLRTTELTLNYFGNKDEPVYITSCQEASLIFEWLGGLVREEQLMGKYNSREIQDIYLMIAQQHLNIQNCAKHAIGCLVYENSTTLSE